MPNSIKYNLSAETLSLKKGNFWIGTGDVGKGPTSSTGFYNGITPPAGGYTIYLNKVSNGPSIYVASNDSELIDLTNKIAGTSYTTANECITYFTSQTDKMIFNVDYGAIVTNGLVLNLDAGFIPSYPKTNTTWYDISSGGNNGTLVNGPTFSISNGGNIVFDNVDDYGIVPYNSNLNLVNTVTLEAWVKYTTGSNTVLIEKSNTNNHYQLQIFNGTQGTPGIAGQLVFMLQPNSDNWVTSGVVTNDDKWYQVVGTYDRSSTTAKIYIDGILKNTNSSILTGPANNTQPLLIGSRSGVAGFGGSIGNIKIYNRVLSSTEILKNYQSILPRFTGNNIVMDGLVLYLDAGYTSSYPGSGTSWKDISGYGNNGTLLNGPTFNSGNGGSIVFDGTNDTTNFGNILNIGLNSWTMSCWVKFTTGNSIFGIMGKTSLRSYVGRYTFYVDNNTITALFQPSNNYLISTSILPYLDNKFHNIVMTINRTGFMFFYIDGISQGTPLDVSSSNGINLNTSTDNLYIGSYGDVTGQSPSLFLNGSIANALIYNRALSSTEIQQNFNVVKSKYGL